VKKPRSGGVFFAPKAKWIASDAGPEELWTEPVWRRAETPKPRRRKVSYRRPFLRLTSARIRAGALSGLRRKPRRQSDISPSLQRRCNFPGFEKSGRRRRRWLFPRLPDYERHLEAHLETPLKMRSRFMQFSRFPHGEGFALYVIVPNSKYTSRNNCENTYRLFCPARCWRTESHIN
jgi:hypothetical protein